ELYMRHSNLATIPYTVWVDDVVVGAPNTQVYGTGCQGTGGVTPGLSSQKAPPPGKGHYSLQPNHAPAPPPPPPPPGSRAARARRQPSELEWPHAPVRPRRRLQHLRLRGPASRLPVGRDRGGRGDRVDGLARAEQPGAERRAPVHAVVRRRLGGREPV